MNSDWIGSWRYSLTGVYSDVKCLSERANFDLVVLQSAHLELWPNLSVHLELCSTLLISLSISHFLDIHVKYYSRYTILIYLFNCLYLPLIYHISPSKTNDEDNPINFPQLSISCIWMSRIVNRRKRKKSIESLFACFKCQKFHRFEWRNFQLSVSYFEINEFAYEILLCLFLLMNHTIIVFLSRKSRQSIIKKMWQNNDYLIARMWYVWERAGEAFHFFLTIE